ncbi:hypothetical protein M0R45_032456 [Rubus argutus]|uniref:CCHC-type domain-containing protein n=1 Tax=Rubus argutus TaxID=59490 RepID=A0AAW1WHQ6_RUBAR
MAHLNKLDFDALEVSGRNYFQWTEDVKLHLTAKKIRSTIQDDNVASTHQKAEAMILIRRHMDRSLQREYLGEEEPRNLWAMLADRFDHQKDIFLPEARHDWHNIRFQDFKSVNEYNSEICRIRSILKYCGEELTENDLLEKTFSTFPASCMVLQQQYRERKFTKFAELITTLLLAEKNNSLLLKNDQSRPVGTRAIPLPEANVIVHRDTNREWRNRGHGRGAGHSRPRHEINPYDRDQRNHGPRGRRNRGRVTRGGNHANPAPKARNERHPGPARNERQPGPARNERNPGPARRPQNQNQPNLCYRCGGQDHWSRTCRAPAHVVDEYHAGRGTRETNFAARGVPDDTTLEIADFQTATGYDEV